MDRLDEKTKADIMRAVSAILAKGNDALIQSRKNGIVVIEQKKKIAYNAEIN